MKSNKIFIIIISIVFITVISLLIYVINNKDTINVSFSNKTKSDNTTNNINRSNNRINIDSKKINKESGNSSSNFNSSFSILNDYDAFFSIDKIINDYYDALILKKYNLVYDKLDKQYISSYKKTLNNISDPLIESYDDATFYSKVIYANTGNNVVHYFVTGELQRYNFGEEVLEEIKDINFLVIIDSNSDSFSITPLLSSIDLVGFIRNYDLSENKTIDATDNNLVVATLLSDEEVAIHYLNYYKSIIFLNSSKAYDMLSLNDKNDIGSYENFLSNIYSYYELFNPNLFSYTSKGEAGQKQYSVVTTEMKKISFKESSIMNFSVEME